MQKMFSAEGKQSAVDYVLQSLVEMDLIEYGDIVEGEDNTVQVGFYGDDFIGVMQIGKEGVQHMTLTTKNSSPTMYETISGMIKSSDRKVHFSAEDAGDNSVVIIAKPALNN